MTKKAISRRDFLKTAGITVAAATVTCSGLGAFATHQPKVDTPELSLGENNTMNKRLLITYATRAGSTAEVVTAIGESLASRGLTVDVKPVKENPSLKGYDGVIMASAIRTGNWLPEAVEYVKANQQVLKSMPVALVTVHMNNTGDDEASTTARLAYLNSVRPLLNPHDEVFFSGAIKIEKLSMLDRLVLKMVKATVEDKRDWNKIRNWQPALNL